MRKGGKETERERKKLAEADAWLIVSLIYILAVDLYNKLSYPLLPESNP